MRSQWTWWRDWSVWSEDWLCCCCCFAAVAVAAVAQSFHCWLTFSLQKVRRGVGSCERMRSWKLFRLGKSGGRSCEIGSHCCENLLPVEAGVEGGEQRSLQEFILWRYLLHRSNLIKELKNLQSRVKSMQIAGLCLFISIGGSKYKTHPFFNHSIVMDDSDGVNSYWTQKMENPWFYCCTKIESIHWMCSLTSQAFQGKFFHLNQQKAEHEFCIGWKYNNWYS